MVSFKFIFFYNYMVSRPTAPTRLHLQKFVTAGSIQAIRRWLV
jgi:hypothetical protein